MLKMSKSGWWDVGDTGDLIIAYTDLDPVVWMNARLTLAFIPPPARRLEMPCANDTHREPIVLEFTPPSFLILNHDEMPVLEQLIEIGQAQWNHDLHESFPEEYRFGLHNCYGVYGAITIPTETALMTLKMLLLE